jgi:hypothetical protein
MGRVVADPLGDVTTFAVRSKRVQNGHVVPRGGQRSGKGSVRGTNTAIPNGPDDIWRGDRDLGMSLRHPVSVNGQGGSSIPPPEGLLVSFEAWRDDETCASGRQLIDVGVRVGQRNATPDKIPQFVQCVHAKKRGVMCRS